MKKQCYRKIVLIIFILPLVICISSCATLNLFKTLDMKKQDLQYAYKYGDTNAGRISTGMLKEEVINAWGQPSKIYTVEPNEQNYYNYYSDEMWIYAEGEETMNEISYRICFRENKVIKIIELDWKERFVMPWEGPPK
jgi:outer membrane protein assembly factor BamE (lipoprotein component of BamABCDE complex)